MIKNFRKGYYRPQLVRDNFYSFNGRYDFVYDDEDVGEKLSYFSRFPIKHDEIIVPFSYETKKSGINEQKHHKVVWYHKNIGPIELKPNQRFLIHFEGADYFTKVYLNGIYVGFHEGGNCRFTFDLTPYLIPRGENQLVVRCYDSMSCIQPRGKQRWLEDSFGCWYVQTTGIWKSVWGEVVSDNYLDSLKIIPDVDQDEVQLQMKFIGKSQDLNVKTTISFEGSIISTVTSPVMANEVNQKINLISDQFDFKVKLWDVSNPNLYDVDIDVYDKDTLVDHVESYFGLRKIEVDEKGIRLNNSPLYQKLILAQNYWKDSGYTMAEDEDAINDIQLLKEAGFNGLRIHQKIEDERFLAYCDIMGALVWAEFPATYQFEDKAIEQLTHEWMEVLSQEYNHPSIIVWVPFNESWGVRNIFTSKQEQAFVQGIYYLTKAFDSMRPVISNDGWEHVRSDIITLHDYDSNSVHMMKRYQNGLKDILENRVAHGQYKYAFAQGFSYQGQPIIISEYGGISLANDEGWGYNDKVKDSEELIKRYDDLTTAIRNLPNVSGYCYTQLTDVYQEMNGLLDFNHKPKCDLKKIKEINER